METRFALNAQTDTSFANHSTEAGLRVAILFSECICRHADRRILSSDWIVSLWSFAFETHSW